MQIKNKHVVLHINVMEHAANKLIKKTHNIGFSNSAKITKILAV